MCAVLSSLGSGKIMKHLQQQTVHVVDNPRKNLRHQSPKIPQQELDQGVLLINSQHLIELIASSTARNLADSLLRSLLGSPKT